MKLNTEKPFITRIGGDPDGIRYIQNDNAFDGGHNLIGKMVNGKLFTGAKELSGPVSVNPPEDAPEPDQAITEDDSADDVSNDADSEPEDDGLGELNLDALKVFATASDIKFAGNIGADKLREKIRESVAK